MSFRFVKDAVQTGKTNLFWGAVTALAFIAMQHYVFSRADFPIAIAIIAWFIGAIIVLITFSNGISLLRSGGKWEITIDNHKIVWRSPNESVDKSFNLQLQEIDKLVLRHKISKRPKKSGALKKADYIIVTKSGVEFELSSNSGVNLPMVFTELERKGIQVVTEDI